MSDIYALSGKIRGYASHHDWAIQIQASVVRSQHLSHGGCEGWQLSRRGSFVNQTLMSKRSGGNATSFEGEGRGITLTMNGVAVLVRLSTFKKNGLVADNAKNILAVHDGRPFVISESEV